MPDTAFLAGWKHWVRRKGKGATSPVLACRSGPVRAFRSFFKKQFLPPVEAINPVRKITNPKINFSYVNGYKSYIICFGIRGPSYLVTVYHLQNSPMYLPTWAADKVIWQWNQLCGIREKKTTRRMNQKLFNRSVWQIWKCLKEQGTSVLDTWQFSSDMTDI